MHRQTTRSDGQWWWKIDGVWYTYVAEPWQQHDHDLTAHTHTKTEVHHLRSFACTGGDLPRRRPIGLVPMVAGSWWPRLQRAGPRTSAATAQLQRDARSNARRTKDFWPDYRYQ